MTKDSYVALVQRIHTCFDGDWPMLDLSELLLADDDPDVRHHRSTMFAAARASRGVVHGADGLWRGKSDKLLYGPSAGMMRSSCNWDPSLGTKYGDVA